MPSSGRDAENPRLSPDEAILVLEQADLATHSGSPLPPGLRAMAEETSSRRVRRSLLALARRLELGEPLVDVLSTLSPSLSSLEKTLVEQGAGMGRLDTVLHWVVEQGRRRRSLQSQLLSSLAYPLLVLTIAVEVNSIIIWWIVPKFKKIFEDFGTELPTITYVLILIADFFSSIWVHLVLISGPVLLFIAIQMVHRSSWIATQRWSGAIPLLGPIFRLAALIDFCNLLAIFVEIRLPLHQAVRLAGDATGDVWTRETSLQMANDIEEGRFNVRHAIEAGVPATLGQILYESKSTESLVEALRGLLELYEARAESSSRAVGILIEPGILMGVSICLGFVVIALFMPLIKLLNDLS